MGPAAGDAPERDGPAWRTPSCRRDGTIRQPARPPRILVAAVALSLLLSIGPAAPAAPVSAAPVDPAFSDTAVLSGLTAPTAVEFASDGRVFVAEKSGLIKVFASLSASSSTTFADLRTQVHNFWDRGLLGMVLHPNFPADPRVYVTYTHDAAIGGTAPRWGSPGVTSDPCPTPPGSTTDGCVVSGRLSVLTASGNTSTGEQVLIEDWCQQYPSHSMGDLRFGSDGALYMTAGDGASFTTTDYGQAGSPRNPCGDPPAGVGGTMTVPTAEGGALRAQDLLTSGDPVTLDGALLRLDPDTGAARAGNPLIGSSDLNARRIVAHGFRNPFRFALRPGTSEIWVGDVGWGTWEEINRIVSPTAPVTNRGWPCIEGATLHPGSYQDLNMCQSLYAAGTATGPYFSYRSGQTVAGETCSTSNGSSLSGLAFYGGGNYPAAFTNALFFSDYSRSCIWVMYAGANGLPDPATTAPFVQNAAGPVQLKIGPGGDLFYPDFNGGTIHRISYTPPNGTPTAVATATPSSGVVPLAVNFSGLGSTDPNGDPLTYAWDLDDDGAYDDSTSATPSRTFTTPGSYLVRLRVTDPGGLSNTTQVTVTATASGSTQYISDLTWVSSTNGWGPVERDRSNGETGPADGAAITLNGVTYAKGLGVHAVSDVRVTIPAGCTTFNAVIGVDDETGANGTVTFQVFGDSTSLYTSPVMNGTQAGVPIQVSLTGRSQLRLVVNNGGDNLNYDHADWADARFVCGSGGGNTPPVPTIATPASSLTWQVGQTVNFSGSASDTQDGALPASALSWELIIHHCSTGCHTHPIQSWSGVASGSFPAPDHEYPSHLELKLTATDSAGSSASTSVLLQPKTVDLSFATSPAGLQVTVGSGTSATPLTHTAIVGSAITISAPTPQSNGGTTYAFSSWSDGGARNHTITAGSVPVTYTATFTPDGTSSTQYISDLTWVSSTNGWGPVERDRSNGETGPADGAAITLNGVTYAKGLGVHAVSDVRVTIPAGCTTFNAVIGVDDETGANGTVTFQVFGDSTSLYTSPVMNGTQAGVPIQVSLTGRSQLRLVVNNGGDNLSYDHADWADARFACGSPPPNGTPTAVATATPSSGVVPLAVNFSGLGSTDPNGDPLTYAWDLDDDGAYDDSTSATPSRTFTTPGSYLVRLRVTDPGGLSNTTQVTVTATASGSTQYISDLTWVSSTNGWGPVERDRSNGETGPADGAAITLNGVTYAKGLGVHAVSDVRVTIPAGCTTFNAVIGVDDETGANGTVTFQVFGDSTSLYTSPVMNGTQAGVPIQVSLTGRSQLRLVVNNGGDNLNYDHADWADARFVCG